MGKFLFGKQAPPKDPSKVRAHYYFCSSNEEKSEALQLLKKKGYQFDYEKMMEMQNFVLSISIHDDKRVLFANMYSVVIQTHHGARQIFDIRALEELL